MPRTGKTIGNFLPSVFEFLPNDELKWVLSQTVDGDRESGAGINQIHRLPDLITGYKPDRFLPMAKNSSLDETHHLVRHIRESEIDDQEGRLLAFPQVFALRPGEAYLSNGWLEFFDGVADAPLSGVAAMMSKTRAVKARHALAIGCVGDIRNACLTR